MIRILSGFFLLMVLLATGCNESIDTAHFMWGDNLYIATEEPLMEEDLEKEIGIISSEVDRTASSNGEARHLPRGTVLYKIKDKEIERDDGTGAIAYKTDEKIRRASKWTEPE